MLQVTAQGLAQDARVIMVTGDVHLVRDLGGTSTRSPLAIGQDIRVGDLVATGGQGRAQLRFSDGAVVSMQPGTQFRIDEYQFDASRQRGFYSLLRGAIRTSSGAIGKRHRDDYRLRTPTATVGIRGTLYSAEQTVCDPICSPGPREGLRVAVVEGRIAVRSEVAEIEVGAGQSAVVESPASTPRLTDAGPILAPPALASQPASGLGAPEPAAKAAGGPETAGAPNRALRVAISGKTDVRDDSKRGSTAGTSDGANDPGSERNAEDGSSARWRDNPLAAAGDPSRANGTGEGPADSESFRAGPAALPGLISLAGGSSVSPSAARGSDAHLSVVAPLALASGGSGPGSTSASGETVGSNESGSQANAPGGSLARWWFARWWFACWWFGRGGSDNRDSGDRRGRHRWLACDRGGRRRFGRRRFNPRRVDDRWFDDRKPDCGWFDLGWFNAR
jgi:hypothetical protein